MTYQDEGYRTNQADKEPRQRNNEKTVPCPKYPFGRRTHEHARRAQQELDSRERQVVSQVAVGINDRDCGRRQQGCAGYGEQEAQDFKQSIEH